MADDAPSPLREPRSSVILRALIEGPGIRCDQRVRNLSRTGACIEHDATLTPGMVVSVSMGAIASIEAKVMWANAKLAGVHFAEPVSLEEARRPRGCTSNFTPSAGWAVDSANPYRRLG